MLHVITHPNVYSKLRAEIASTQYSEPIIPDSIGRDLPYLQAVIKEGLRIFPPVAGLMSKQVPPQGDTWKGRFIPGGTKVGYCAWGIFRREDIWGSDAGEFRPERWLDSEPEKLKEMEGALELIFSYGRWQCLGRPVALMELNKIYVEVCLILKTVTGCSTNMMMHSSFAGLIFPFVTPQGLGKCSTVEFSLNLSLW